MIVANIDEVAPAGRIATPQHLIRIEQFCPVLSRLLLLNPIRQL